jgi:hypothetical protein
MPAVLRRIAGVYQNIVQVDDTYDVDQPRQRTINVRLEGRWRIGQSERHDQVFEVAIARSKRRLPLVSLADPYSVVCISQVQFRVAPGR